MLLATFGANLFGNILTGKGTILSDEVTTKSGESI